MFFVLRRPCFTVPVIGCLLFTGPTVFGAPPLREPVAPPASQPAPVDAEVAALLTKARSAASRVSFDLHRADALQAIARVYARAGDAHTARALLIEARGIIDRHDLAELRATGLVALANQQSELGDIEEARRTLAPALDAAGQTSPKFSRAHMLAIVAAAQSRAGDPGSKATFAAAQAVADRNEAGALRSTDYRSIALAMAGSGDIAGAKAMVERMDSDISKGFARSQIVKIQAAAGDFAGARATVVVKDVRPWDRDMGMQYIALAQAKAGDLAAARTTAAEIHTEHMATHTRIAIIAAQARAGDISGAIAAADHLVADHWSKLEVYADISLAQADHHDRAGARANATRAHELVAKIDPTQEGPMTWTWAYRIIGTAQARAGDDAGARLSFAKSRAAADKGDDEDTFGGAAKHRALSSLATALADAGLFDDARSAAAALPEIGMDRPDAYRIIAAASVRAGDLAGTLRWIETLVPDAAPPLALVGAAEGLLDRKGPPLR